MSMVNELNSELAMAIINRLKTSGEVDRQAMLAMLRQVQTTLRPLSEADRRTKVFESSAARHKLEERSSATNGH